MTEDDKGQDALNESILRRKYLKRAGAFSGTAAVAGFAGCIGSEGGNSGSSGNSSSGGDNNKPKSLTVGTWAGTWQDLLIKSVVNPYKKDTGINIQYSLGQDDPRLNKIISQKKNPPVDVSQQDGNGLVKGENIGLWQELDTDLVPLLSEIPDNFKSDTWVLQIFAGSGLLYNPDEIDEPKSWNAFLDPKYKGKVGLYTQDPVHDLLAFSLAKTNGESAKEIDKAFEMYENIVKEMDPKFATSSEQVGKLFAQNKIVLGRYWTARAAEWNSDGKPVTSVIPKEGAMTTNFGNAIPKNIPDKKVKWAGKFINRSLKKKAAKVTAKNMFYTSPNPNVEYPSNIKSRLVRKEDLEQLKVPDFEWISKHRSDWKKRADSIINNYS